VIFIKKTNDTKVLIKIDYTDNQQSLHIFLNDFVQFITRYVNSNADKIED